jgi:hypothetical protein
VLGLRRVTLAFVLVLLAPSVLAAGLGTPSPPASPAAADDPPGCSSSATEVRCDWVVDTTKDPTTTGGDWQAPAFAKTLAHITVQFEGEDRGWRLLVYHAGDVRSGHQVSESTHPAGTMPPAPRAVETTTHVLVGATRYEIALGASDYEAAEVSLYGTGPSSVGTFHITYVAEPLPDGLAPPRPAATGDFPQVVSPPGDARYPELDLVGAWLDVPRVGDGLFGAHLRVVNLSQVHYDAPALAQEQADYVSWNIHFTLGGRAYYVTWVDSRTAGARSCALMRVGSAPRPDQVIAQPACTWDVRNATLDALVPIESVGSPGPAEPWEDLTANVDTDYASGNYPQPENSASARFGFALGPSQWDALNGCHFCPPPSAPWYLDPLAADNLPNALQVAGAVATALAFLFGLVLLRRRRQKVRALLREIERVESEHERNTREALLALGRLDSSFADMYHRGKLTDDQYQVVAQRLATVATRFALRQGLGLDDGLAGDARAVRVPVQGEPARDLLER